MQRLLDEHHRRCAFVLASRADDRARLAALLGADGWACFAAASTASCSTRGGATGNGWPRRWRSRPTAGW